MHEHESRTKLTAPYGGTLVDLVAAKHERKALVEKAKFLPSVQITPRSMCDLELLAVGAFSPLDRFMGEKDYRSVLRDMRLANGTLFPIPLTLPVENVKNLEIGKEIALRGPTNEMFAVMRLDEIYEWNLAEETRMVLGTTDSRHPLVSEMHTWGKYYLSGPLTVLNLPKHNDFPELRKTPAEARAFFEHVGRQNVVAYQPRHPMHRAHEALTKHAMEEVDGALLTHPVAGNAKYGDRSHYTRVRCYLALVDNHFEPGRTFLSLMPLAVRMAGPRAGLWHGIINRNYGANFYIVGRDPHGTGKDSQGKEFYDSREVQRLFREHEKEIGVSMIPLKKMVYLPGRNIYEESEKIKNNSDQYINVSSTQVIEEAAFKGTKLPEWFTRPEVAHILYAAHPPRAKQGFCVWLTGLPSSGKSTIADILAPLLMAKGRQVTLLDGDVVRTHLTRGLGFGKDDRITNILRVGFVASEVVRHEGVAVCALISPFGIARDQVRAMVGEDRFFEIFVDTPLDVCETRDVKGLFAKAKRGEVTGVTGVDDTYERPRSPELSLITTDVSPEECAEQIIRLLTERGFLEAEKRAPRKQKKNDTVQAATN